MRKLFRNKVQDGSVVVSVLFICVLVLVTLALGITLTRGTAYQFTLDDIRAGYTSVIGALTGSTKDEITAADGKVVPEFFQANMRVLAADDKTVTLRITATSSKTSIKDMKIWTGDSVPTDWVPYKSTITLTYGDFAYARFRDSKMNISDMYTQNVILFKSSSNSD